MPASPVLALLPVLAFCLLWLTLSARPKDLDRDWRHGFVLSSIAWAVYLALTSEVLSLLNGLTVIGVTIAWLVPVVILAVAVRRSAALPAFRARWRAGWTGLPRFDKAALGAIAGICGVLLAIAMISPPNNIDSALYHMARVVHWAQNASLRPYPTIMEHQLMKPIWAETAILHLRVLWGSDRPANLVQWFSMVGSLIAVSGIASLLGARRAAQFLAVAFALSIPMGVLQSTSTQNDYAATFWAICLAYLVVLSVKRRLTGWELAALAASVGLGTLTKGTAFVYAPPFVAWFLIHELTARGIRRAFVAGISIAGIAVVLNAGFWARNVAVYGGPYGTSQWLQRNLWVRFLEEPSPSPLGGQPAPGAEVEPEEPIPAATPSPSSADAFVSSLGNYAVRLAQTAGRNLTFPTGFLSRPVMWALAASPGVFGERYAAEMQAVSWNDENYGGNPLHLAFVPVSLVLLLISWKRPESRLPWAYSAVTLLTFACIPIVIGHGPSIFGVRYQLSFFLLWAPVVGIACGLALRDRALGVLTAVFLLATLPWLLLNKSRPLVGLPPTRTVIGSILVEDQVAILLPWSPRLRDDYTLVTQAVRESGCTRVGLRADSDFLEYPLWWLLDAPQSGVRVESLETTPYLQPFADAAFTPCAVVCANCGDEEGVRGLPLFGNFDSIRLYLAK